MIMSISRVRIEGSRRNQGKKACAGKWRAVGIPYDRIFFLCVCIIVLIGRVHSLSPKEWRKRSIYGPILVDRFARETSFDSGTFDSNSYSSCAASSENQLGKAQQEKGSPKKQRTNADCEDLRDYCGGSFDGLRQRLPYIAAMGFDAIWITPVLENTPRGYHGYWAKNLDRINPMFGNDTSLHHLIESAHSMGIVVMLDIVINHMGQSMGDVPDLVPFNNETRDYHGCEGCLPDCSVDFDKRYDVNQTQMYTCRLSGLPDLRLEIPEVRAVMLSSVKALVERFAFDGVRLDTMPFVQPFVFRSLASESYLGSTDTYLLGEFFDGNVSWLASRLRKTGVDGLISFPMAFTLRDVFTAKPTSSMMNLAARIKEYHSSFSFYERSLFGTFLDNHDIPRFLGLPGASLTRLQNALAVLLVGEGIPVVYYGLEQGFKGGSDPLNRECMWAPPSSSSSSLVTTHLSSLPSLSTMNDPYGSTELSRFIKSLLAARKRHSLWDTGLEIRYVDTRSMVFTRENAMLAAVTIQQLNSTPSEVSIEIADHLFEPGQELCDILDGSYCTRVDKRTRKIQITLVGGRARVLEPSASAENSCVVEERACRDRENIARASRIECDVRT